MGADEVIIKMILYFDKTARELMILTSTFSAPPPLVDVVTNIIVFFIILHLSQFLGFVPHQISQQHGV